MSEKIAEIINRLESKGTIQDDEDVETLAREYQYAINRMESIAEYGLQWAKDMNDGVNPEQAKKIDRAMWMLRPDEQNPIIKFMARNKIKAQEGLQQKPNKIDEAILNFIEAFEVGTGITIS